MQVFDVTGTYRALREMNAAEEMAIIEQMGYDFPDPFHFQVVASDLREAFDKAYQNLKAKAYARYEHQDALDKKITFNGSTFHPERRGKLLDVEFVEVNFKSTNRTVFV